MKKFVSVVLGLMALAAGWACNRLLFYEDCYYGERDLQEYCSTHFMSEYLWSGLLAFALFLLLAIAAAYIWPMYKKVAD